MAATEEEKQTPPNSLEKATGHHDFQDYVTILSWAWAPESYVMGLPVNSVPTIIIF